MLTVPMQKLRRYSRIRPSTLVATATFVAVMMLLLRLAPRPFAGQRLRWITSKAQSTTHQFREAVPHSVCPQHGGETYRPLFDPFSRIPPITSRPNLQKAICEQERRQEAASKLASFAPNSDDDTKFLVSFRCFLS